jgi:uncharacterized protein YodC (DUF2158 family)
MTFVAGLDARAEAVRYCTVVTQDRPNPFQPPATFHCAAARAINEGFWSLGVDPLLWSGLRSLDREVFYFVASEALLAAKAWREAHQGASIPELPLAQAISGAYWILCVDPERRRTWDTQQEDWRQVWLACARRVQDVAEAVAQAEAGGMSVDIKDLRVGSVVRLASGSPKMVVTGFGPAGAMVPYTVMLRGWSDRIGMFVAELKPEILVYPRPQIEVDE